MRIHRDWEHPPRFHKECLAQYAPKSISCTDCGKSFSLSTNLQLKCKQNGWSLPERCSECKHDALLIKAAVGALRDSFPFPLQTTIEKRGFIFTDKVAVVRNRRTGDIVAEVKMDESGFIFTERVATAYSPATKERIGTTYDRVEGFIFEQRVAKTHDGTGNLTHVTRSEKRGFLFQHNVAVTRRSDNSGSPIESTGGSKQGILSSSNVIRTDYEKRRW
jgi:DNA-binding winged helix-turn-helix (wHTH) protein